MLVYQMVSLLSSLKKKTKQRSPMAKDAKPPADRLACPDLPHCSRSRIPRPFPPAMRQGPGTRQVEKTYIYMCKYKCMRVHTQKYVHILLHIYKYDLTYMYVHICMYV